jgi:hypothetical protein
MKNLRQDVRRKATNSLLHDARCVYSAITTNVLCFGIHISFPFETVSQLFQRTSLLLLLPSLQIQEVRVMFHLG